MSQLTLHVRGFCWRQDWTVLTSWYATFRYTREPLSKRVHTVSVFPFLKRWGGRGGNEKKHSTFVMRIRYFSTRWSLLWHPASNCHTSPLRASGTPLLTNADNVFGLTLKLRCLGVDEGIVTIIQIQINEYMSNNWCVTSNMSNDRNSKTVHMLPEEVKFKLWKTTDLEKRFPNYFLDFH